MSDRRNTRIRELLVYIRKGRIMDAMREFFAEDVVIAEPIYDNTMGSGGSSMNASKALLLLIIGLPALAAGSLTTFLNHAALEALSSGLEHTFVWNVETTAPHDLEEFSIELGVARWNDLKFVPERTFEMVVSDVRALHGLEDWAPGIGN